jgi:transposase
VVTAERPAAPIEKRRPSPGLLAHVVTAKYAYHLPLSIVRPRSSPATALRSRGQALFAWVAAADLLTLVHEGLKTVVLANRGIHTHDTVAPVIAIGPRPGKAGCTCVHE